MAYLAAIKRYIVVSLIILGVLAVTYGSVTSNSDASTSLVYEGDWGGPSVVRGGFAYPSGIAVHGSSVFVVDSITCNVLKFDNPELLAMRLGGETTDDYACGSEDGHFGNPRDVAVDDGGYIYVADNSNDRVQKFSPTGDFVAKWGQPGAANGQFSHPNTVTVGASGDIFVGDEAGRIQRFSSSGTFVLEWGGVGTADSQFQTLAGIEADSSGNIYALDFDLGDPPSAHVKKFDSLGNFLTQWDVSPDARAISTNVTGDVIVADGTGASTYGSSGLLISKIDDPEALWAYSGIATDLTGDIYVSDYQHQRVRSLTTSGTVVFTILDYAWRHADDRGEFDSPSDVTVGQGQFVYVSDTGSDRIQKFSLSGDFIDEWGTSGQGPSQMDGPKGITANATGDVYVAELTNNRVHVFDATGDSLLTFGHQGTDDSGFTQLTDVAVDSDGLIYTVDPAANRIQKFTADGTLVDKWGSEGTGDSQLTSPSGIAVDISNDVYVSDSGNHRVQKFSSEGEFLETLQRSPPDSMQSPAGITFGEERQIYVADPVGNSVHEFSPEGDHVRTFGEFGYGGAYFNAPTGLAASGPDGLYVADTGQHRIAHYTDGLTRTSLTAAASSDDVSFGKPVSVSGLLTDKKDNPIAGRGVLLYRQTPGESSVVGSGTTDSTGAFSIDFYPADDFDYNAVFRGEGSALGSTSDSLNIKTRTGFRSRISKQDFWYGRWFELSGGVFGGSGSGLSNRSVSFETYDDGAWKTLQTKATDLGGFFYFTHKPEKNATYRVRTGDLPPKEYVVTVATRPTVTASATKITLGQSVILSGKVGPNHYGHSVKIYRQGYPEVLLATRTLSRESKFQYTWKPTKRGRFYIKVDVAAHDDHLYGYGMLPGKIEVR